MNEHEQLIAIAEECGWKTSECTVCGAPGHVAISPTGESFWDEASCIRNAALIRVVPAYLKDLNAMNSAERKLPASERDQYQQQLYRVCERAHRMAPIYWLAINASAEQRAEAFLRTIRKWSGSSRAAGVDCSLSNPSTEEKGHNEKLRDDDEQTAP